MALLKIRHYPDPVLKKVAVPVTEFDESLRQLANDMKQPVLLTEVVLRQANYADKISELSQAVQFAL